MWITRQSTCPPESHFKVEVTGFPRGSDVVNKPCNGLSDRLI